MHLFEAWHGGCDQDCEDSMPIHIFRGYAMSAMDRLHELHEKHENLWWIALGVIAVGGLLVFAGKVFGL